jgi:hypothetical protein
MRMVDAATWEAPRPLFVSDFWSFWPPKAVADCQTLSFSVSFYKICLGKNHIKINVNT